MKLEDLGYTTALETLRIAQKTEIENVGRIISEHKERYIVRTSNGDFEAEITGNMRFTARGREDFPAVGDWVALNTYEYGFAIIHHIFPRYSVIKRKDVGADGEIQIIATNVDYAFLIQAVDRDFNINRLERYLTLCYASNVNPIILLSKTDLINKDQLDKIFQEITLRIQNVPIVGISNVTETGYDTLVKYIKKGKSYCLLGSSGVGKSTLLNHLSGKTIMKTDSISDWSHKGKHITSYRSLFVLEDGGIIIDTPGMREVGLTDTEGGLETTFEKIMVLGKNCRYKDCKHIQEAGCKVLEALDSGDIDQSSYLNYLKMVKEEAHFQSSREEKHRKDKEFGKMMKNYKKDMKNKQ